MSLTPAAVRAAGNVDTETDVKLKLRAMKLGVTLAGLAATAVELGAGHKFH